MRRTLLTLLYTAALAVAITPLMGGCSGEVSDVLDEASDVLHDWSQDVGGDHHDHDFWFNFFGGDHDD